MIHALPPGRRATGLGIQLLRTKMLLPPPTTRWRPGRGPSGRVSRLTSRWFDRRLGALSVGEPVQFFAVAAVEGDPLAMDGHRLGAPDTVRPHLHGSVGASGKSVYGHAQAVVPDTFRA